MERARAEAMATRGEAQVSRLAADLGKPGVKPAVDLQYAAMGGDGSSVAIPGPVTSSAVDAGNGSFAAVLPPVVTSIPEDGEGSPAATADPKNKGTASAARVVEGDGLTAAFESLPAVRSEVVGGFPPTFPRGGA